MGFIFIGSGGGNGSTVPISSGGGGTGPSIISADRVTQWNPGIPGGRPTANNVYPPTGAAYTTYLPGGGFTAAGASPGPYSVNPVTFGNNSTSATTAIQNALNAATAGQIVFLGPGKYVITGGITIPSGVVLRGVGPGDGGASGIGVSGAGTGTMLRNGSVDMGNTESWATPVSVTVDVTRGDDRVTVSDGTGFSVGDIIGIDRPDDASVYRPSGYDGNWVRGPTNLQAFVGPPSTLWRCRGQVARVIAKPSTNVLQVYNVSTGAGAPIHFDYPATGPSQVYRLTNPTSYAGLEEIYITLSSAASGFVAMHGGMFSWIHHVETDGSIVGTTYLDGYVGTGAGGFGDHMTLTSAYRCMITNSYVHHVTDGGTNGGSAYGIVQFSKGSDCLFENNICRYMNKPFMARGTGGGNVVAYNYIDDSKVGSQDPVWDYFQETSCDPCHGAHPLMDLYEGNYAPHIGADSVWGSSGYLTFYRNRCTGLQRRSFIRPTPESSGVACIDLQWNGTQYLNVVGNVLGVATQPPGDGGASQVYQDTTTDSARPIWRIGCNFNNTDQSQFDPNWATSTYYTTLLRSANYDYVNNALDVDTRPGGYNFPDSMYLSSKPSFFGTNAWPPYDPFGANDAARTKTLPAKARFDAGTPNAT
jgi:hypothetical protein